MPHIFEIKYKTEPLYIFYLNKKTFHSDSDQVRTR